MISGRRSLRRMGLYVFARVNPGDIHIRHHHTGERIRLHSFRHKGYWYHGRQRERDVMAAFSRLVRPGDRVLEAGGHIGYITLYFAKLVGPTGTVAVFEPGNNNLPYLRANVADQPTITVHPVALGSESGDLELYLEDLTGQNNSLVPDFDVLSANQGNAVHATVTRQPVTVTTIDEHVAATGAVPDFIKIDIEGFEYEALLGAADTLERHHPRMMVEVQAHHTEITERLHGLGYRFYGANGAPLDVIPQGMENIFCLPADMPWPS
ncbi:FkbM family methyltransferase [Krasilnikovia sp. M28-CT-15]|uniref:FkbM family methyltransferase n=1 Tax=Krasilnikovia sp. M28-CT-15 TaxID=3373540 RepID=UPI0038760CA9